MNMIRVSDGWKAMISEVRDLLIREQKLDEAAGRRDEVGWEDATDGEIVAAAIWIMCSTLKEVVARKEKEKQ